MASPSTGIDNGHDEEGDNSGLMRVLIVGDDVLECRVHETLFGKLEVKEEVQTEMATDKEDLDLHLSGSSFDIILMDIDSPIMDGLEVMKELRAKGVKSMIVGLTSQNAEADRAAFMAAGLDECLEKPLTDEKIKSLVDTLEKNN
ncbi:two-component response regulator 24-like [Eucalyptus grandis]|uniref:Uncharacterized protein n=2 Tax=Eucalyptus grandis TaxID=71139 RepID=A0ACC3JVF1_EUCGR|nr:two-component response regulator 24-like [Eucalyptus grandis]KAK3418243.1 hypothetical protein EUGRSUZ_H04198 [Eucalyptus grandis]